MASEKKSIGRDLKKVYSKPLIGMKPKGETEKFNLFDLIVAAVGATGVFLALRLRK